ncbi:Mov34/MPN/PAD-1 family protein [Variovorax sp. PvP013]|uniref:Mov34/MPN/PAD-1 family protein n=1 Tax=Variovorax sp. PvP013 TaxID=3156435 RepID=UPI003D1CFAA5
MSKPKPFQRFVDGTAGRFEVLVDDPALRAMVQACKRAGSKETGGILIGRLQGDGRIASVCEATEKPADSSAGWTWFQRGSHGLRGLLVKRWETGLHYLGEWHFHPGAGCQPSGADLSAMAAIALDERYACAEPMLIILGGRPPDAFQLSVTVFPRGESTIALSGCPLSRFK